MSRNVRIVVALALPLLIAAGSAPVAAQVKPEPARLDAQAPNPIQIPALVKPAAVPYVGVYAGFSGAVNAVALSADGRQALSGGHDNVLRLWDTATGQLLRTFDAQTESINSVAFSPDRRLLLSGGDDKKLRLWDMTTGLPVMVMEGHTGEVSAVAFSPDGRLMLSGSRDKTLQLWDMITGLPFKIFQGHTDAVSTVAFSPDGRQVLSGGKDKTLRLWDVATGLPLKTIEGQADEVLSVAFSPDGRQVLSGGKDKTLRLWDAATGLPLKTLQGHTGEVLSVAFSPDGRQILSASRDKTLKLWDAATGRLVNTLGGHADIVTSAAFSFDGSRIVSGSWDKTLKLWNVAAGQPQTTIDVSATSFAPNGHFNVYFGQTLPNTPDLARLNERLQEKGFKRGDPVFLRVFKGDHEAELWIKRAGRFELFATYPICAWSGQLGPKQTVGDYQSPEGFYAVGKAQLNPNSRYRRAFNLGFPNAFDRAHGRTGANLMVHGGCKSVGCYAMTDAVIDELWALVTAALDGGQERVEVHVFPFRMTDARLAAFGWHPSAEFWRDMKRGYDLFEASHTLPQISVCNKRYVVTKSGNPAAQAACSGWRPG